MSYDQMRDHVLLRNLREAELAHRRLLDSGTSRATNTQRRRALVRLGNLRAAARKRGLLE